jgi:hypothetical protein
MAVDVIIPTQLSLTFPRSVENQEGIVMTAKVKQSLQMGVM